MKKHPTRSRHLLWILAVLSLLGGVYSSALAQSETAVAVLPFESQETLLGVAVAERVASAVRQAAPADQRGAQSVEVLGPDVALTLIPPYPTQRGFLPPFQLLGESQGIGSRTAAMLLYDALGVDGALTGRIDFAEGGLELTFHLATTRGLRTFFATAPEDSPERLAETVLAVLEQRLGMPSARVDAINLSAPYGDYVEGLALLSGGFLGEAQASVERALQRSTEIAGAEDSRYEQLLRALEAAEEGDFTRENLPLAATLALNAQPTNQAQARRIFQLLTKRSALPTYQTWLGVLAAEAGATDEAESALDAAARYPYGRALRALYSVLSQADTAGGRVAESVASDIERIVQSESWGALMGAMLAAQQLEDAALERRLAAQLSRLAPSLPYTFERLSFIAFDEDRPLDAAQALKVATQLEPESDLYWTNLGWAYYLLGRLEESEDASQRAVDLDADAFIAWYNLGLARAATGRLGEAMDAYDEALSRDRDPEVDSDPGVDEAAVEDLENALNLYPDAAPVHFALATLYEAQDRTDEAITQFERYLAKARGAPRFRERAEQRLSVLRTPPAPIKIAEDARLSLGPDNLSLETFQPGDRVYPDFELFTSGLELPKNVTLTLQLLEGEAPVEGATFEETFDIPGNAVALQIDDIGFGLPTGLAPGDYALEVTLSASRQRRASATLPVVIEGTPSLARQLISRGVVLRSLASNRSLYDARNLALGDKALTERLLSELKNNAEAAQDALPEVTTGRFKGLGGGALFNQSSAEDIRDFLGFLLEQRREQRGVDELSVSFVDAYAQWALDGAPAP